MAFCGKMCTVPSPISILENHKNDLTHILRVLRDNLSGIVVGITLLSHLKKFIGSKEGGENDIHISLVLPCSCIFDTKFADQMPICSKEICIIL